MNCFPPPAPPASGAVPSQSLKTSALAVWSLVLGILGLCSFLPAIPALLLGIIGLIQIRPENGLKGTGMAVAGVVLSSLTLLCLPILAALALPAFLNAKETAKEVQSIDNVRQLYLLTQSYEIERGNHAKDWDSLFAGTETDPVTARRLLTSPFGPKPYVLLSQGSEPLPPDAPFILDPNPGRRGHVAGFASGEVKVVPAEELGIPVGAP